MMKRAKGSRSRRQKRMDGETYRYGTYLEPGLPCPPGPELPK